MDGRLTSPRASRSANDGDDARCRSSHSDSDPGEFSDIPFGDGEDDGESLRPRAAAAPPAPTIVQLPKHRHSSRPAPVGTSDEYVEPIDPEFLKELPPELQQELLLEHAAAQKRANDAAIQRAMLDAAATSEEEEDSTASRGTSSDAAEAGRWTCHVCTFANHPEILACEICEALRADVAGYYEDEGVGRRSRAGSVSSNGGEGYSKLAQRIQSSVFSSSLKKLKMPATPATTSMTQKDDPTAEDLLIAATIKIQQLQTSATQGVQSLMAKASASRRASPSPSELLSPTSAAASGKKPSAQAVALLRSLQQDLNTKCEPGDELYETLLRRLWDAIYQDAPRSPRKTGPAPLAPPLPQRAFERVSDGWVDIGFQGPNPDTDFRGGGLLALKCLVYVFEAYPHKMIEVVSAQRPSDTGKQWYPVCVAGINLTCMIAGLLRLGDGRFATSAAPYWALFEEPSALYQLYFHAFVKMDAAWHRMNASYMEFGVVLKATRRMVEHMLELAPQTLTQLSAAADKTFIDRFVATASKSYLADTENGECPDPFNLLEDESEVLVTSPRTAISAVLHKLTGFGAAPTSSASSAAAASSRSPPH